MPSIEKSLASNISLTGLTPHTFTPAIEPLQSRVTRNPFCRCPVPQVVTTTSDTISQADLHGVIPQHRVWVKS